MSYFDDASLVMIPSGYKTSKVYSVKPTDGTGDLTFARSNDTATRVNSAGLIEKVRTNIVTYSEDFGNAAWVKTDCTVTTNTTANPINGALTADTIVFDGADDQIAQVFNVSNHTFSVYVKGTAGETITIGFGAGAEVTHTLTGGFDRVSVTGSSTFFVYIGTFSGATARTIIVYGAQLETGDIATAYIATTSAAVSVGPVANVPRLDYSGGASCPKLLLEPQRTNLALYSEQFDNAAWSKVSATVTANTTTSPSGHQDADTVNCASGRIQQNATLVSGTTYVASLFAKIESGDTFSIQVIDGVNPSAQFNLQTQQITNANGGVGLMKSYGNGWYRCELKFTSALTGTNTVRIVSSATGIYAWGAQLEAGSYSTSYVPSLGAAVTRGADAATKTSIGSLFGSSYTLFGEYVNQGVANTRLLTVKIPSAGNYDNFITIFQSGTGLTATGNDASSVAQFSIASGSYSVGQTLKFALRCEANNVAFYINGVQIGTDNTATIPAVTALWVGNYVDIIGRSVVNQVLTFPTALSNSDLAALTA